MENSGRYEAQHPLFAAAFDFLRNADWEKIEDGKIELVDGGRLYVAVQSYETREESAARYEVHRKYIDIQFIVSGEEKIGYLPEVGGLAPSVPYDETGDIAFYDAKGGSGAVLREGSFMILFPGEFHKPSLSLQEPSAVRKAVVKVLA